MGRRAESVTAETWMDRFGDWFVPEPNTGCWLWARSCHREGYGQFRGKLAHRVSYILLRGPVPAGLELDHLCRVRSCVNPDHLEAVTHRINLLRGNSLVVRFSTHCKKGHEKSGHNLILKPNGYRECRACTYELYRERYRNGLITGRKPRHFYEASP